MKIILFLTLLSCAALAGTCLASDGPTGADDEWASELDDSMDSLDVPGQEAGGESDVPAGPVPTHSELLEAAAEPAPSPEGEETLVEADMEDTPQDIARMAAREVNERATTVMSREGGTLAAAVERLERRVSYLERDIRSMEERIRGVDRTLDDFRRRR